MLREILESLNEANNWKISKSTKSGNKGKVILSWTDGEDKGTIGKTGEDEFQVSMIYNDGESSQDKYLKAKELTNIKKYFKGDIPNIENVPNNLISKLDDLDTNSDW